MSIQPIDPVLLDRAYDDGKLTGFLGLATSAGCPFNKAQAAPRIAWLDGYADGAWKGGGKINLATQPEDLVPTDLEAAPQPELEIVNLTIVQLRRLSEALGARKQQDGELDSALQAAMTFIRFARLAQATG